MVEQVTGSRQDKLPTRLIGIRLNSLATHGEQFPAYWTDDGRITVMEDVHLPAIAASQEQAEDFRQNSG